MSSLYLRVVQGSAVWLSQALLLPGQVYNLKGRQPHPPLSNFCVSLSRWEIEGTPGNFLTLILKP